jgi:membrane protein YqaA with SNARE-associated domain
MKRFSPLRILTFMGFSVVIIFIFVLLFLHQIQSQIEQFITIYGYPAIFIITLITETLAQPIGPEIPILAGRIIKLNPIYVSIIVITASVIASLVNYMVGSLFYKRVCEDRSCEKYSIFYKKYGKYGLLIASLGPVPYVPFCWFSGAFGMKLKTFFYFGIFPRILRIIFVSYILFLFL